jgi:hypothetical protein
MKKECVFAEHGKRRCSALKVYDCEGCRFFKTEDEYNAGRAFAEHLLARKGLRPVVIFGDGGGIMSVEEIEDENY